MEIDPEIARKELKRYHKWGTLPPGSDILGTWLVHALTGKREFYHVDRDGRILEKNESPKPPFRNPYEIKYETKSVDSPFTYCCWKLSFAWDQWVECTIKCEHGEYRASSDFFNFTEAMIRAVVAFNEADHPFKDDADEEEGDNDDA